MDMFEASLKSQPQRALGGITPPCEAFPCPYFMKCGIELLACDAFVHFVSTGRVMAPGNRNESGDTWEPTREKYSRAMGV